MDSELVIPITQVPQATKFFHHFKIPFITVLCLYPFFSFVGLIA